MSELYNLINQLMGLSVMFGVFLGTLATLFYVWIINVGKRQKKYRYESLCSKCKEKHEYKHKYPIW